MVRNVSPGCTTYSVEASAGAGEGAGVVAALGEGATERAATAEATTIVGRPLQTGPYHGGGGWVTVSANYFEVFRIPVRRGRTFNVRDDGAAQPVVIINEAMAKQYWKDADPLNARLPGRHWRPLLSLT